MAFCGVSLANIDDGRAECAEQDQTARMCSLILLYTHRKTNLEKEKEKKPFSTNYSEFKRHDLFVCLGFYAVSTVFYLFNGDNSQIRVSWTIFNQ